MSVKKFPGVSPYSPDSAVQAQFVFCPFSHYLLTLHVLSWRWPFSSSTRTELRSTYISYFPSSSSCSRSDSRKLGVHHEFLFTKPTKRTPTTYTVVQSATAPACSGNTVPSEGAVTSVYTDFTTVYCHSAFIFIIRSYHMFRHYILAIFRGLQVRSTCMAACHG